MSPPAFHAPSSKCRGLIAAFCRDRKWWAGALALAALCGGAARAEDAALRLHRGALIVDLHVDTPYQLVRRGGYSLSSRNSFLQIDVPRMREGNMGAQFFALWPPPAAVKSGGADGYCRKALTALRRAAKDSGGLELVDSVEGIERARAAGKIAGLIGMEGAECLMGDIGALEGWRKEGLRYLGLTWNFVNPFATPAKGAPPGTRRGLTARGRALLDEAHRLGVLIDVSHADEQTFWDVVRHAPGPFIASHSSSAAVWPHSRNVSDEQARAIARAGGVIGVNYYRPYLGRGAVSVEHVARHVRHLVRVAGPAHVALGSDFDGNITVPDGLEDPSKLPALTAALLRLGLSEDAVRSVLGENVMRVLRDAGRRHDGARLYPLRVTEVRPRTARRVFDHNRRTRFAPRGSKAVVRARLRGRPSRVAIEACGRSRVRLELADLAGQRVARVRRTIEGRVELPLPVLPEGGYTVKVSGFSCLREIVVYEATRDVAPKDAPARAGE